MTDPIPSEVAAGEQTSPHGGGRWAWGLVRNLFRLRTDKSRTRVRLVAMAFAGLFAIIGARLAQIALVPENGSAIRRAAGTAIAAARPELCITHAPGHMLVTDMKTSRLAVF